MFRKLVLATALLAIAAGSTAASAKPFPKFPKGPHWGGGIGLGLGLGLLGAAAYAASEQPSCYIQPTVVNTPYGQQIANVRVCQ